MLKKINYDKNSQLTRTKEPKLIFATHVGPMFILEMS
jgi:hypothetical protein